MNLNKEQLKIILDDLYAIDANLRNYEPQLEKIIRDLIELEPEVKFDENFRSNLRAQLMERAAQIQAGQPQKNFSLAGIFSRKFSYALAGALALAVVVLGAGFIAKKQGIIEFPGQKIISQQGSAPTEFKKLALGDNAFGSLKGDQSNTATGLGGGGAKNESGTSSVAPTYGIGGGGGTASSGTAQAPAPSGIGGGMYPYFNFKYVYKGDPLNLTDSEVEVLRRVGFDKDTSSLGSLLKSFSLGLVNFSSFSSLKLQNINLTEDKDYGYMISVNAQEGSVYISQNWLKWPQPYKLCAGTVACVEQNRVKISDVLSDDEAINIAKDFMAAHGINLDSYGEPAVTDTWRIEYERTADKSQFYIPDSANVLFPLKVNGQFVYDEGGSKTGINVSVDFRQKKVSAVGNITSLSYQASNYPAETDTSKILKVVEQGGNYWGYPVPMANSSAPSSDIAQPMPPIRPNEERTIEVGTPSIEYVLYTNYTNNQANFLLVPSLIFPITKTPDDTNYYYPKNIVVPLAKELLDQRLNPPGGITPYMMK
jgi:hypothetical protein